MCINIQHRRGDLYKIPRHQTDESIHPTSEKYIFPLPFTFAIDDYNNPLYEVRNERACFYSLGQLISLKILNIDDDFIECMVEL